MKTNPRKGESYKDHKKRWLKDPKNRELYYTPDNLGLEVAILRRIKGLTQKELAQKIGTKQEAISRFEQGDYMPTLNWLHRVARALDKRLEISFKRF